MAWSWLRRRADRPSGLAPAAATPPPTTAPVRPQGDWQELPPVQRTLQPLAPVAPLDAFTTRLAAHQNPSFLGPLGHQVDPDGPGGLISGLTSVRPGDHIPYAHSTALVVPATSKPRPAVQRRAISWSTATTAEPVDSPAVDPDRAAPVEENPGSGLAPTAGDVAEAQDGEAVTPAPTALTTPPAPPARVTAAALPMRAVPGPTAQRQASDDSPVSGPEPEIAAVAGEVVVGEPTAPSAGEAPIVPLLGAPGIAATAATTTGRPASVPIPRGTPPEPPAAVPAVTVAPPTPLPVSRLAEQPGIAEPLAGRSVSAESLAGLLGSGSRLGAAETLPPAVQPRTPSSATPVPSLQRQLAAVPEYRTRSAVLPAPFTIELPVVGSVGSEPPPAAGLGPDDMPVGRLTSAGLASDDMPVSRLTSPAAGLGSDDMPVSRLTSNALPIGGRAAGPDTSPEPTPVAGLRTTDLPTAPMSSSNRSPAASLPTDDVPSSAAPGQDHTASAEAPTAEPAAAPAISPEPVLTADSEPAERPTSETPISGAAEPTAPLSGFAARIASLTNLTEDDRPASAADQLDPYPVQRLVDPALRQLETRATTEPSGSWAATPSVTPERSPEPGVVPTVSRTAPLIQRIADQIADPVADPAPRSSGLPFGPAPRLEAATAPPPASPSLPVPAASAVTPVTSVTHGEDPGLASSTGGVTSAAGAALPVVARMASIEPTAATALPRPPATTETAELVSHRPPLAVRADLSSAVAPSPAVQRVTFSGGGQAASPRHEAGPDLDQLSAPLGNPLPGKATATPVTLAGGPRMITDEAPTSRSPVTAGPSVRQMDPIPVQRRPVSLPTAATAGRPLTPATGPATGHASTVPPSIGPARSFAAMFGTTSVGQAAAEAEDHAGYTTVQLQAADEPITAGPPAEQPTAAPAAEPPGVTSSTPTAATPTASPGGAPPTAGAAAADLDEMARRLFEPLSARLRAELWLDRERAGLVTDARH